MRVRFLGRMGVEQKHILEHKPAIDGGQIIYTQLASSQPFCGALTASALYIAGVKLDPEVPLSLFLPFARTTSSQCFKLHILLVLRSCYFRVGADKARVVYYACTEKLLGATLWGPIFFGRIPCWVPPLLRRAPVWVPSLFWTPSRLHPGAPKRVWSVKVWFLLALLLLVRTFFPLHALIQPHKPHDSSIKC